MKQRAGYIAQKVEKGNPHQLFYTLYSPDSENIRATILVVHGMQEHCGRYHEVAQFLAGQNFVVLTYDHSGHGKTAKAESDLGFFQTHKPDKQMVNDAENMANYVEKLYPDVPHFVLGHSMGSFVIRCLLQQAGSRFDGAVIIGTGGKTKGAKLGKFIFAVLNVVSPRHRTYFNKIFGQMNNRRFRKERNNADLNWLSLNEANRDAYLRDPLCGAFFTNNGFYTLLSLNVKATRRHWAESISTEFPFLFLSGEDDPIGNFGKGVRETVENMKTDGFKDVSIQLYPGMRHEILNEEIRLQVYRDIVKWISGHLSDL